MPQRRKIRYIAGEPYMTCTRCGDEHPMTDAWFRFVPYRGAFASECRTCAHISRAKRWERTKNTPERHNAEKQRGKLYNQKPARKAKLKFRVRDKFKEVK